MELLLLMENIASVWLNSGLIFVPGILMPESIS